MTSRYLKVAVAAALLGTLAACESPRPVASSRPADTASAGSVDHQQREVEGRIDEALRTGRISRDDHRALKGQADEIRRDERRYMADGTLTLSERHALLARLSSLSAEVERRSERR